MGMGVEVLFLNGMLMLVKMNALRYFKDNNNILWHSNPVSGGIILIRVLW